MLKNISLVIVCGLSVLLNACNSGTSITPYSATSLADQTSKNNMKQTQKFQLTDSLYGPKLNGSLNYLGESAVLSPDNSGINVMASGPNGTLYVGTMSGNVMYAASNSNNHGWIALAGYAPHGPFQITAMVVGPDGTVYIGDDKGRVAYANTGSYSWTMLGGGNIGSSGITALAIGPNDTIYAGDANGNVKYANKNSQSIWTNLGNGSPDNQQINSIVVTSRNIFVGTNGSHVWSSWNPHIISSSRWVKLGDSLDNSSVLMLALDNMGQLYAATYNNNIMYYATYYKRGRVITQKWVMRKYYNKVTSSNITSFVIGSDNTLYIGTQNGNVKFLNDNIFTDGWHDLADKSSLDGSSIMALAINKHSGFVYTGTQNGNVEFTAQNLHKWYGIGNKAQTTDGSPITVVKATNGKVYVGTYNGNVYFRTLDSNSWTQVGGGSLNGTIIGLMIGTDGTVYADTLFESVMSASPSSNKWRNFVKNGNEIGNDYVENILIDAGADGIYAGTSNTVHISGLGIVNLSTNQYFPAVGCGWDANFGIYGLKYAQDINNNSYLYAVGCNSNYSCNLYYTSNSVGNGCGKFNSWVLLKNNVGRNIVFDEQNNRMCIQDINNNDIECTTTGTSNWATATSTSSYDFFWAVGRDATFYSIDLSSASYNEIKYLQSDNNEWNEINVGGESGEPMRFMFGTFPNAVNPSNFTLDKSSNIIYFGNSDGTVSYTTEPGIHKFASNK